MNPKPAFFKPADIVVLALVLAAGVKTLPWLWTGTGRTAVVSVDGSKAMRLQLEGKPRRAEVIGALGPVEVEWGDQGVRVAHAPCPRQLCVQSGWVRRRGHRLLCIPSHLEIAVEGAPGETPVDAVTF